MSESKYNLSFKIKQHTPIIHFQHDHTGATLRASELKPKLDKFLFDKCKNNKCPELPFGENGNLDYKVKIENDINYNIDKKIESSLFFGNIGIPNFLSVTDYEYLKSLFIKENKGKVLNSYKKEGNKYVFNKKYSKTKENIREALVAINFIPEKRFIENKKIITVKFFSFNKSILKAIKNNFANFILINNFGTRQSKGFGSFYLDKSCEFYEEPKLKYKFSVQLRPNEDVFYYIALFYKTLRGGINGMKKNSFYFKSMMFSYAKSKNIQWDKKSIKEHFYNRDLKNQISEHGSDILKYSSKDKYLMKDLLGLSSRESWREPYKSVITKKNRDIDRFKSPIMFKPLKKNDNNGYNVFFYAKEINNFLNNKFEINSKNSKTPLFLSTPKYFDVDDFIQFALKVDLNTHVDSIHHGKREFEIIKKIYSDINKNLK